MQYDMVTQLIDKFNDTIDLLIKDFKEFNLDEKALGFLATRTRNFITFCDLTVNNIIFSVLERTGNYSFEEEVKQSKDLINKIFENLNKSLDHILEHDNHEEHEHGHDHSHEHHIHIDVEDVQEDINNILSNLEFLKKLFADISDVVLSSIKYQLNNIDENVFRQKYEEFKENINNMKNEFEDK